MDGEWALRTKTPEQKKPLYIELLLLKTSPTGRKGEGVGGESTLLSPEGIRIRKAPGA